MARDLNVDGCNVEKRRVFSYSYNLFAVVELNPGLL